MAFWNLRLRRHRSHGGGRIRPLAIVGICLAATILLTVIVGNLLNLWLDDETMDRLTEGHTPTEPPASEAPPRQTPWAQAYPFSLGDETDSLLTDGALPAALSIPLNHSDGQMDYTSPVSRYQSRVSKEGAAELTSSMEELIQVVPYLSGTFYPQAPHMEDASLLYAATLSEVALLREFVTCGASEILLIGLSFEADQLPITLEYLRQLREALGNTSIGVAVPLSVATANGWNLIPTLAASASFLAIDLTNETVSDPSTEIETLLLDANYFIVQHQMRLLLDSDQTDLITAAEATILDFQILKI